MEVFELVEDDSVVINSHFSKAQSMVLYIDIIIIDVHYNTTTTPIKESIVK